MNRRIAVVTGAGRGLGRAAAVALSDAGLDVCIISRTRAGLEETAALIKGPCLPIAADVSQPDQVRDAFARLTEAWGGLDVLINNAGSYRPFPIDEASDEDVTFVVAQNFLAPIWCVRAAIPLMRARAGGDIVNISTQTAAMPQPYMIVYGAAKAALETLSQGLRYELTGEPFRIIVVQLGVIADSVFDPEWVKLQEPFLEKLSKAGLEKLFVFPGSRPENIAASIVHAVTSPRDMNFQTISVRSG